MLIFIHIDMLQSTNLLDHKPILSLPKISSSCTNLMYPSSKITDKVKSRSQNVRQFTDLELYRICFSYVLRSSPGSDCCLIFLI